MASYPPNTPGAPPPPQPNAANSPQGQGFTPYPPPGYASQDPRAWKAQAKAQERLARAQIKMQRDQMRFQMKAQARAARSYSVVGPLLLLGAGIVFLLLETGHLSWARLGVWYGHWWPLLLIGAGALLLLEWALNGRRGALLGGGMVTLLIFLGVIGWSVGEAHRHFQLNGDNFAENFGSFNGWSPFFGETHEEDGDPGSAAIAADGALLIHNPHGDVSVTGASEDGQVHVTVHKEMRTNSDSELANVRQLLQPSFTGSPAALQLSVGQANSSHADLQITVPRGVTVTVDAEHGAVNVAEMHAPVLVSAGQGEVSLSGITGAVTTHMRNRNGSFSAHSVTGGVSVDGRGGDMNLSDITGPVALQGEFFGTTHVERVNGSVSFDTFRTQFKAARVDGQLEISSGSGDSPLQGEAIMGPVTLHTRDRVITLDRVQGSVDIINSNGAVTLSSVAPAGASLGAINVQSTRGSVEVRVPSGSSFTTNAQTHDGSIDNDFGLPITNGDDRPVMTGTVGHGGPSITLSTDDGDVSIRKGTDEPLPATQAGAPTITQAPKPTQPAKPSHPAKPKQKPAADATATP